MHSKTMWFFEETNRNPVQLTVPPYRTGVSSWLSGQRAASVRAQTSKKRCSAALVNLCQTMKGNWPNSTGTRSSGSNPRKFEFTKASASSFSSLGLHPKDKIVDFRSNCSANSVKWNKRNTSWSKFVSTKSLKPIAPESRHGQPHWDKSGWNAMAQTVVAKDSIATMALNGSPRTKTHWTCSLVNCTENPRQP